MSFQNLLSSLKIERRKDTRLYGKEGETIGIYSTYDVVFPNNETLHVHETLLKKARVIRVPYNDLGKLLIYLTTLSHKKEQGNPAFPFGVYPVIVYRTADTENKIDSIICEWWDMEELSSPTFDHHLKELKIEFGQPVLEEHRYIYQYKISWDEILETSNKIISKFE